MTKSGRKILFSAAGYSDYTKHRGSDRNQIYIDRHKNNDNCGITRIDTAGVWSRLLLWHLPTIKDSYNDIKRRFLT